MKQTQALADYLPGGRTFEGKNIYGSNLRALLTGLAGEFTRAQEYLRTMVQEYYPDTTDLYLSEWEKALGIPDDCFSGTGTHTERRRDILVKLLSVGLQTAQDIIDLAALFGKTVTVDQVSPEYLPLDVPFYPEGEFTPGFTIIVSGMDLIDAVPPLDVPFLPGGESSILECLLRKQIPANCELVLRNT